MKILVTGANGFIGSQLCALLEENYSLVMHTKKKNISPTCEGSSLALDINGQTDWYPHLTGVDTIIHLASVAHNKSSDLKVINEVNVNGTIRLAKEAIKASVKRFIFISSIGVLGNSTSIPYNEESTSNPHSAYAESKLQAERELIKIADESGLEVVIIRPVLVYGIGAPGNFAKLVKLIQKTPILPFALCRNKRSFISRDNLVDFISVCIEDPKAKNEIFCISDGKDVSIREFTDGIAVGLNKSLIQLPIPMFMFNILGAITGKSELIEQLVGDLQVDSSKAREILGWIPPVSMSETFSKLTNNK